MQRATIVVPEIPTAEPVKRFEGARDFDALHAAQAWLTGQGYSFGRTQRGAAIGVLLGDVDIQKWRNLNRAERETLDGFLTGDFRHGPVYLYLKRGIRP
jgi:hypothetical protein